MLRVRQFLAVTGLALFESLRQPVLLLLTCCAVALVALLPLVQVHQLGEEGKLVRDGALAFHFVFGLFVSAYAASSSLARELRAGTASAVLSKPVDRSVFFLAKYFGVLAVALLFSVCTTIATLLSERVAEKFVCTKQTMLYITDWRTGNLLLAAPAVACLIAAAVNRVSNRPFGSTAFALLLGYLLVLFFASAFFDRDGTWAPFAFRVDWRIVPVSILITLALAMLSAIALALSGRLSTVPTLTLCTAIFVLGLMSDHLFGGRPETAWLHGLIPNWQNFWLADALTAGGRVPLGYMARAGGYAAGYIGAVLCLGLASFRYTEV